MIAHLSLFKRGLVFRHGRGVEKTGNAADALLALKAFKYSIVYNGNALFSGSLRNRKPEIISKAFEIAGSDQARVDARSRGTIRTLKFGAEKPARRDLIPAQSGGRLVDGRTERGEREAAPRAAHPAQSGEGLIFTDLSDIKHS